MGDGFRQAVQGGGAGVQSCGESLPPGIQHGVDGVRGAAAEFAADFLNGGAIADAQERVGGVADVALSDAARRRAKGSGGYARFTHVANSTLNVWCYLVSIWQ